MPTSLKEPPSSALIIALLRAIPQTALTPSTYQVVLDAVNMIDNALQANFPPVITLPEANTEKVGYPEGNDYDCKRAIAIILSNTKKSKKELPFFREMTWQQILDWAQANEPELMGDIVLF
jgi:hypothetical protein